MGQPRNVLVIANANKTEALRMATGLTLLDDNVRVTVLGKLDEDEGTRSQLDALEFADVPVALLKESDNGVRELAEAIIRADCVLVV